MFQHGTQQRSEWSFRFGAESSHSWYWISDYCVGYIAGAGEMLDGLLLEDGVRAAFDGKIFCLPDDVTKGAAHDRVLAFLRDHPNPTDQEIREALSGNLCRCTGYQGIIKAVRQAADTLASSTGS